MKKGCAKVHKYRWHCAECIKYRTDDYADLCAHQALFCEKIDTGSCEIDNYSDRGIGHGINEEKFA